MSATGVKSKSGEVNAPNRLPYYQINPSYTVRVICCVLFIFLTEICLAHYIYRLISAEIRETYVSKYDFQQNFINNVRSETVRLELNRLWRDFENDKNLRDSDVPRRKRQVLNLEENLVNGRNDGPNVEFFDPKLRGTLEAKGSKGTAPGGDSWVWLTSYSRIPVSILQRKKRFKQKYVKIKILLC